MNANRDSASLSRRDFLARAAKAGVGLAFTAFVGEKFASTTISSGAIPRAAVSSFPDFSMPGLSDKMCVVTGADRVKTINLALAALGGMGTFVQRGDRVLLKVNAAFASPPMLSATSHPDLVAEVTTLCLKAGAASVLVTDNPINDPVNSFELSGIGPAAKARGAQVILPRENLFRPMTLAGGSLIQNWPVLHEPFKQVNKVIGMAPVKDHHRSGASMTMKNWYGLLGGRRNIFHQNIHDIIKELAMMIKPTFVILDGTTTMITNGPTGGSLRDLKPTHTMIVSTDQVAGDALGATLLGKRASDLPYITKAAAAGVGTANYDLLNPIFIQAG